MGDCSECDMELHEVKPESEEHGRSKELGFNKKGLTAKYKKPSDKKMPSSREQCVNIRGCETAKDEAIEHLPANYEKFKNENYDKVLRNLESGIKNGHLSEEQLSDLQGKLEITEIEKTRKEKIKENIPFVGSSRKEVRKKLEKMEEIVNEKLSKTQDENQFKSMGDDMQTDESESQSRSL